MPVYADGPFLFEVIRVIPSVCGIEFVTSIYIMKYKFTYIIIYRRSYSNIQ